MSNGHHFGGIMTVCPSECPSVNIKCKLLDRTKWRMGKRGKSVPLVWTFSRLANYQIIIKKRIILITIEFWLNFWQIWHFQSNILSFVEEQNEEEKLRESHNGMTAIFVASFWSYIAAPQSCSPPSHIHISILGCILLSNYYFPASLLSNPIA